jgi:transcriptional regulator with XRE-family HTH domain
LRSIQIEIGARIKWARELVEPNRAEFARLMRVDRTTLQKIEDGDRAPSIFNILEIAHRLRVPTDYLLRGTLTGVDGELAALLVTEHPELDPHRQRNRIARNHSKPVVQDNRKARVSGT